MNYPQASPGAKPGGGGALKWILLGCGGFILLGIAAFALSGYFLYRSFSTDPAKAEATAQEMVTFEKPEGYRGAFSMSVMGVKSAMLTAGGGKEQDGGAIMVAEFPAGAGSQEQFEAQVKQGLEKQGRSQEASEARPAETFKVRGKDVTAQVGLTKSKDGSHRSLQYMITLDGKAGKLTMLTIIGPEATTDHAWVQKFLDTVK